MRKMAKGLVGIGFLAVVVAACAAEHGSGSGAEPTVSASGGVGSSAASGTAQGSPGAQAAPSGSVVTNNGGFVVPDASMSTPVVDSSATDSFVGCAATSVEGKQLPLDVFMLLDQSYSMDDQVAPGQSKWALVTAAINAFATDPASAGINVGLQYLPGTQPGVPTTCTSSAQCGAAGPCMLNFCAVNSTSLFFCNTDNDCVLCNTFGRCEQYQCIPAGQCQNSHDVFCEPGVACGPDANGFDLGNCEAVTTLMDANCVAADDCVAQDYEKLAVPIAALPGNAPAISASLAAHEPNGNTPTEAALTGVLAAAQAYAKANPNDTVVIVLATDGQPDEIAGAQGQCTSPATDAAAQAQVAQVAAGGLAGTPSIRTYGIGVFTPSDLPTGTATLDQLAAAGGTTTPFIIATSTAAANTGQQFSAALASIRGSSLPCNYQVPVPSMGTPDFFEINVRWTSASGTATSVPYVESAADCDPTVGGWYYNVDPAEGGTPTTIEMCAASCSALKAGSGRVDILLGCQTQRLLPR